MIQFDLDRKVKEVRNLERRPFPVDDCTVDKTEDPLSQVFEAPYKCLVLIASTRFEAMTVMEAVPFINHTTYVDEGDPPGTFFGWWDGGQQYSDLDCPIDPHANRWVIAWVKLSE